MFDVFLIRIPDGFDNFDFSTLTLYDYHTDPPLMIKYSEPGLSHY
jgi:hypothetical protein